MSCTNGSAPISLAADSMRSRSGRHRDAGPLGDKLGRDRAADSLRCAGDERHPAVQTQIHGARWSQSPTIPAGRFVQPGQSACLTSRRSPVRARDRPSARAAADRASREHRDAPGGPPTPSRTTPGRSPISPRMEGPGLESPFALTDVLRAGLGADPSGAAVITRDLTLTWAELEDESSASPALRRARPATGERVATLMPNRPALIAHHLACLKAQLVSTPLNYRYMPAEIDHALKVSGAALLVHHAERDADIANPPRAAPPARYVRFGAGELPPAAEASGTRALEELLHAAPTAVTLPESGPTHRCSSSSPRGAPGRRRGSRTRSRRSAG